MAIVIPRVTANPARNRLRLRWNKLWTSTAKAWKQRLAHAENAKDAEKGGMNMNIAAQRSRFPGNGAGGNLEIPDRQRVDVVFLLFAVLYASALKAFAVLCDLCVLRVRNIVRRPKQIGPHKAGRSCHEDASYQPFVSSITTMIDDSTSECRRTATV
ncbi:hypothetical protein [Nevskia sp.]|uniref:hypothetical protein n=1 Tax=Nevskia sp. TaxID=1929292 RepID=UPI0025D60520|nr:hypothetical protein [Nevskia sp.]